VVGPFFSPLSSPERPAQGLYASWGEVKGRNFMAKSTKDTFGLIGGYKGLSVVTGGASLMLLVSLFLAWITVSISLLGIEIGIGVTGLGTIGLSGAAEALAAAQGSIGNVSLANLLASDPNGATAASAYQLLGYATAVLSIGALVTAVRSARPGSSERNAMLASLGAGVVGIASIGFAYYLLTKVKESAGAAGGFVNPDIGFYLALAGSLVLLFAGLRARRSA
jgi:hypothetical protein